MDGGVRISQTRAFTAEANTRSNSSKVNVSGPGGVGDKAVCPKTSRQCLGSQVLDIDGLNPVVATAEDGENREAPQRPGHVVQQQVASAEDQGGPDDGAYPSTSSLKL